MASLQYTIKLENIAAVGATCTDFSIEWDTELACGSVVCVIQGDELHIEIPEDCQGECIEAVIRCNEPCTNCTPQRVTICPCDTNADCDDCSTCDGNVCMSVCEEHEFCEDAVCKECNDETPCPDDRICVGGKCVCPPGFFETDKGECWPCDPNNVPNCYICTREGLKPIDCGDQICDPSTGDCVDCIGSGDCGTNEQCNEGDCICKDGFVRNPVTGNCDPAPECEKDSDCPDCEECNQFGDCQPKECPDGFICEDDDCKKPCEDGTDCPDGFGCNPDTGFCEECSDQDCTTPDCEKLLGCECNNSGDCADVGGCNDTPCNNLFDCPEGCVCVNGVCEKCENFDCDNCDIPGCECDNNGDCVYDDDYACEDKVYIEKIKDSCDLKGVAEIKDSCSCDPITLTFKPTSYNGDDGNRIRLDFRVDARKGLATNFSQSQGLPRLDATGNTNITDNDLPDTGSVSFRQDITLVELDINGNPITNSTQVENIFNLSLSFNGVAFVDVSNQPVYKVGEEYTIGADTFLITKVNIRVVQNDAFDFTSGSGCVYDPSNSIGNMRVSSTDITRLIDSNFSSLQNFVSLTSDDVRNPIFTWFRNDPQDSSYDVNSDVIRQVYKPLSSLGVYTDTLLGPDAISNATELSGSEGELWSLYGYALEVDCACGDNYDDYGKAKFCQPDEVTASFEQCNREISIAGFSVCDVNKDRNLFTGVPANAQVFFDLYLNGSLYKTYKHDQGSGKIQSATGSEITQPITYTETITSAKIVQRTSFGTICENVISVPEIVERDVDTIEIDCNAGEQFIVSIPKDQNPVDIDYIVGWGAAVSGVFTRAFDKDSNQVASANVVFEDGCTKQVVLQPDCCGERELVITTIGGEGGSDVEVRIQANNMQLPIDYTIQPPSGSSITGTIEQGSLAPSAEGFAGFVTIQSPVGGTYTVSAQGSEDCDTSVQTEFFVSVTDAPEMEISGCEDYFTGQTKVLSINTNQEAVGGVINYTKTDISNPSFPTTNETLPVNSINLQITVNGSTTFDFISITKDGNTYPVNKNCTVNEIDSPVVTSVSAESNGICLGNAVSVSIEATPNSVVTISGGVGEVQIDGTGNGEFTFTPSTVGTKTFTATKVVLNGFEENLTGPSDTVVVSNAPTISATSDCAESNPNSNRVITVEVADSGGTFSAVDYDNQGNSVSFTGGGNGDGTSTFVVTLPSSTVIEALLLTYTNSLGCEVSTIQGVPTNCSCPSLDVDVEASSVCVGTGDNMVFEVNSVDVEGTSYSAGQINVTWFDLANNELSSLNPYNYNTSGEPSGNVQLKYEVEIATGTHAGCTTTGFVTGTILTPQSTTITTDGTNSGGFDGTLCDGGSIGLISTLEGSAYSWKLDSIEVGTSRTYTFSEAASASDYVLTLEVTDVNGCIAEDTLEIFVTTCGCAVQYAEIGASLEESRGFYGLTLTDGRSAVSSVFTSFGNIGASLGFPDSNNDTIAAEIVSMLQGLGDSAGTEVFWQYINTTDQIRFYIFGSDFRVTHLTTHTGGSNPTNLVNEAVTQDCSGTDAPGCTDVNAQNYRANLNGNSSGVSITDPQSDECFGLYYTALFASDLVGNAGTENVAVTIDGGSPVNLASGGAATPTNIGGFTYNTKLADTINAAGLDVVAAYPTETELSNDSSNLGVYTSPSGCGCTSKVEYIRLYWPVSSTFTIEGNTSGCIPAGIDQVIDESKSFTLQKCSGGAGDTVNINAINLEIVEQLP